MDLDRYLARIGYDGPLVADRATLTALHRAHLHAVPFENLSIGWGEPIVLDVARHHAKIVERRRGGFCYELNGLFAWLLETIGFRVSLRSARVWAARDGVEDYGPADAHLFLHVDLGEPWLADVGFGDNFLEPKRLVDALVQEEGRRAYRYAREDDGTWTLWQRGFDGAWKRGYHFADVAHPMDHFAFMCREQQTSPGSVFVRKRICSLALPDGRITLADDQFIETDLDGHRRIEAVDDAAWTRLLAERFGIQRTVNP